MNQMNSRYLLPGILMALLWLWAGCTQAEPAPTATSTGSVPAVSQTTPTILPTNTAVPPTATPTATLPPTATTTPIPTATATPPPTPVGPGPTVTPISVSDKVGFELVAQVGGTINSFAVSGDYILVGQGPRLVVLDASDPAELTPIGQSEVLPGIVSNVMVRGETASTEPAEVAVLTAGHLLMVWDISDPTQPVPLHSLALPAAGSLLWQDDIIYAAGLIASQYVEQDGSGSQYFESYVATIDVSGPPRLLDQITIPYNIHATALVGDILYLGMGHQPAQGTLGVVVTDPAQLGDPISIPLATDVIFSLRAYDDTLLVGGYYKLSAFDVSDPRRPRYLWREEGAEIAQVYDFAVRDGQVHTLGWQAAGGFIPAQAVIDLPQPLPDPAVVTPVGITTSLQRGFGLLVVEDHLFRLLESSLSVFRLGGEEQTFVGGYTPPLGGPAVISDDVVYVGLETGYIARYRLPDLAPVDQTRMPQRTIYSLTEDNGRLYLTADNALHIYDAATLAPLGHFDSDQDEFRSFLFQREWRRFALPVVDNIVYAYALGFSTGQEMITRLDVNSPDQIRSLPPIFLARDLHLGALAANERWLVASLYTSQPDADDFLVFYERATLAEIRTIPLPLAPTTLWLQGNLLLAGGGGTFRDDGFLQFYQMPDGLSLTSRRMPGVYDMVMGEDNLALVTTHTDRRLLVLDFTDPVLPQAVGAFDLPYHRGHLAVSGAYVLVSDPVMGLYLLRLER
jgi:hypothetical protein